MPRKRPRKPRTSATSGTKRPQKRSVKHRRAPSAGKRGKAHPRKRSRGRKSQGKASNGTEQGLTNVELAALERTLDDRLEAELQYQDEAPADSGRLTSDNPVPTTSESSNGAIPESVSVHVDLGALRTKSVRTLDEKLIHHPPRLLLHLQWLAYGNGVLPTRRTSHRAWPCAVAWIPYVYPILVVLLALTTVLRVSSVGNQLPRIAKGIQYAVFASCWLFGVYLYAYVQLPQRAVQALYKQAYSLGVVEDAAKRERSVTVDLSKMDFVEMGDTDTKPLSERNRAPSTKEELASVKTAHREVYQLALSHSWFLWVSVALVLTLQTLKLVIQTATSDDVPDDMDGPIMRFLWDRWKKTSVGFALYGEFQCLLAFYLFCVTWSFVQHIFYVRFRHLLRSAQCLLKAQGQLTEAQSLWLEDMRIQTSQHMDEFNAVLYRPFQIGGVLLVLSLVLAVAELIRIGASSLVGLTIPMIAFVFYGFTVAVSGKLARVSAKLHVVLAVAHVQAGQHDDMDSDVAKNGDEDEEAAHDSATHSPSQDTLPSPSKKAADVDVLELFADDHAPRTSVCTAYKWVLTDAAIVVIAQLAFFLVKMSTTFPRCITPSDDVFESWGLGNCSSREFGVAEAASFVLGFYPIIAFGFLLGVFISSWEKARPGLWMPFVAPLPLVVLWAIGQATQQDMDDINVQLSFLLALMVVLGMPVVLTRGEPKHVRWNLVITVLVLCPVFVIRIVQGVFIVGNWRTMSNTARGLVVLFVHPMLLFVSGRATSILAQRAEKNPVVRSARVFVLLPQLVLVLAGRLYLVNLPEVADQIVAAMLFAFMEIGARSLQVAEGNLISLVVKICTARNLRAVPNRKQSVDLEKLQQMAPHIYVDDLYFRQVAELSSIFVAPLLSAFTRWHLQVQQLSFWPVVLSLCVQLVADVIADTASLTVEQTYTRVRSITRWTALRRNGPYGGHVYRVTFLCMMVVVGSMTLRDYMILILAATDK